MNSSLLPEASNKQERPLALKKVRKHGMNLYDCSDNIKDDETVVFEAMKNDLDALQYASDRLKDDKFFIMKVVREIGKVEIKESIGFIFKHLGKLKNDKDIALLAIEHKPRLLKEVSSYLRDDVDVVLKAIQKEPTAIEYASDRCKNDFSLVKIALQQINSFKYISSRLQESYHTLDFIYDGIVLDFFNLKKQEFVYNTTLKFVLEDYLEKVKRPKSFYVKRFNEIEEIYGEVYAVIDLTQDNFNKYYKDPLIHILKKMDNKDILSLESNLVYTNQLIQRQKILNFKLAETEKKKNRKLTF